MPRSTSRTRPQGTRKLLLEAAGQVFAEKGFERSTAKEIAERAGTNAASVNYYFGGIEGLYGAVLEEARDRLFSNQAIEKAIAGKTEPREKLEAVFGVVARALLGPISSSWVLRILGRDIVTPTVAGDAAKEKLIMPRALMLRRFVGDFIGLPEDDPAVARACIGLVAPLFALILVDRRRLKRALPSLELGPDEAPVLADHLVRFAIAGLERIGRDAREAGQPASTSS